MNKLLSKTFLSVSLLFLTITSVNAITRTIGGGGDYATLKAAFDAINAGAITGAIELQVQGNTTEAATPVLNASGSGAASYSSIKVYPTVTGLSITGNFDMTVDLNGANNVTFDGRLYNAGGSLVGAVPDLSIINTRTTASVSGIPMAAFRFRDGASNNTVSYCKISARNTGQYILFSTSTAGSGNVNNIIDNNEITNNGAGRTGSAIYSNGTAGKENSGTISNNKIYNTWQLGVVSASIQIGNNNIGWTISGNSIYETAGFACSQGNITIRGIYISSTSAKDIHIQNNFIGGNAPSCVGTLTSTGESFRFLCIDMAVGATSVTKSDITGNTIKSFNYSTISYPSDNNPWNGIVISSGSLGDIDIKNNTIGDNTTTGNIIINNNRLSGIAYGMYLNNTSGTIQVDNNIIGSITCDMSVAGQANALSFEGIIKTNTGGNLTISNNIIGSTTIAKSIYTSSLANTSFGTQILYGIESQGTGVVNINNNTIANLSNASTNAGTPNGASIIGITLQNSSNYTVTNNTVRDLDIACNNTSSTSQSNPGQNGSMYGIYAAFINGGVAVARNATINDNKVFNLTNSYSSFGGNIYGIVCVDGGAGTPTVGINRNFVHSINITGATSTTAVLTGILGVWNSSALNDNYSIANNIVYLNSGSKTCNLTGINSDGTSANLISFQYNTIYLEGNPTSGSKHTKCINSETNVKYRIRNNILYNACDNTSGTSTAKHYTLYLNGSTTAEVDYNLYYAPNKGGVLGYYGSDKTTYKIYPGKDAFSANYDPKFNNTGIVYTKTQPEYYQSCQPTQGTPITIPVAITSDFGNVNPRNTPAVGAWENATIGVPGAITGTTVICSAGNQTYSIVAVNGVAANGYTWNTPTGWTAVTPNTGTSMTYTVPYNVGTSDTISVTATGSCNGAVTSPPSKLAVYTGTPPTPGAITGNTPQCSGSTSQTYKINAVKGAQTYNWTLPADWVITTPAAGTNTLSSSDTLIVVTVGNTSGDVTVSATNTCGTGTLSTKNITVNPTPSIPTGPTTPVFCSSPTPRVSDLNALGYSGLSAERNWYTVATGGTPIHKGLYAFTTLITQSYWVSITTNNCEGPRLKVDVTVNASPSAPTAAATQYFCHSPQAQISNLVATPTGGNSIRWYAAATGGAQLLGTQNLVNGTTYYASQSDGTCESSRTAVKAVIFDPQVPSVAGGGDTIRFCAGATPKVSDFKLQLVATGGTPKVYSTNLGVVPMLDTDPVVDMTSYYATKDSASCESSTRHKITVRIADPSAPSGTSPQTFCQSANPNLGKVKVTGTAVKWYAAASGGAALDTATTLLTNGTTYYASQTVGSAPNPTCESTNRLPVTVTLLLDNILSLTSAAGTDAQVLCQGDALVNIIYHVSGTLTGVTPSISPALPSGVSSNWDGTAGDLTITGTPALTQAKKTYTVSLTGACGTSTKTFDITVNAVPAKPVVNSTDPACGAPNVGTITITSPAADGGITTFSIDGVDYSNTTGIFNNVAPSTYNVTAKANGCTSPATSVTIKNQPPLPTAPLVGTITQPTCATPTATVALSGLPAGAWTVTELVGNTTLTGSGTTANFASLPAGKTYTFTVTSGACTSVASLTAVVNAAPTPPAAPTIASVTQPTCSVSTGTIVITTQAGVEYSVGGAYQVSETFSGLTPGNYTIAVRSLTDNTCSATGPSQTINAQPTTPADPTISVTQPTCSVATGGITITNATGSTMYYITSSTYKDSIASGVFANVPSGTYTVTAKSAAGCTSNGVNTTINPQPSLPSVPIVDSITQPSCSVVTGTIYFSGLPASGSWTITSVSSGNTTTGSGLTGSFSGLNPGTYTFTVTNAAGCVSLATNSVQVNPVVENTIVLSSAIGTDNQKIENGNKLTDITYITTGAQGATFVTLPDGVTGEWKDSVITIKGMPTVDGDFNYIINLIGGCGNANATGNIIVESSGVKIPNAFSPNGDGENDRFVIKKSPAQIIKIQVFSRWGTLVYERDNYDGEWDGKGTGVMEGQDLLSGTYYYLIQVRTSSNAVPKEYTGYITLKR
jgi:gliding motility-associated-like protein